MYRNLSMALLVCRQLSQYFVTICTMIPSQTMQIFCIPYIVVSGTVNHNSCKKFTETIRSHRVLVKHCMCACVSVYSMYMSSHLPIALKNLSQYAAQLAIYACFECISEMCSEQAYSASLVR